MGKGKGKGSEGGFSEDQLEMYRECFKLMDIDKDGVINKNDLRAAFDNIGSLVSEQELESMLGEIGGAVQLRQHGQVFRGQNVGVRQRPRRPRHTGLQELQRRELELSYLSSLGGSISFDPPYCKTTILYSFVSRQFYS